MERRDLTEESSWRKLKRLYEKNNQSLILKNLFADDPQRFSKYCKTISTPDGEILFDFSKNLVNQPIMSALFNLAKERKIEEHRDKLFSGARVNFTEDRSALHVALRNRSNKPVVVDGLNVMTEINKVLVRMKSFTNAIRTGKWLGFTGKRITDVVNIGTGGSGIGPKMVTEALKPYGDHGPVKLHFVSNVDGTHLIEVLKKIDVETTLFIIASKSFETHETRLNALTAKQWFFENAVHCCDFMDSYHHQNNHHFANHFVAVTQNIDKAAKFGISRSNVFEIWNWVVGRFSLWSAIGLSIALYIGFENFERLLEGAHFIDQHFQSTPIEDNVPMLMGLIGVWYNNFYGSETYALLPYDQYLRSFAEYFQQGDMESNGKSIDATNNQVRYNTGPIVWGEPGTNGQNSFYQLIHQGTRLIPCDFIAPIHSHNPIRGSVHHEVLLANFLAQTESLMIGKTIEEVLQEMEEENASDDEIKNTARHRVMTGNNPSNSILLPRVTPFTLGALIAIYEHKIFVQGAIWDINSFDQYGGEMGRNLAKTIQEELRSDSNAIKHDQSTNNLINYIKEKRM